MYRTESNLTPLPYNISAHYELDYLWVSLHFCEWSLSLHSFHLTLTIQSQCGELWVSVLPDFIRYIYFVLECVNFLYNIIWKLSSVSLSTIGNLKVKNQMRLFREVNLHSHLKLLKEYILQNAPSTPKKLNAYLYYWKLHTLDVLITSRWEQRATLKDQNVTRGLNAVNG